MKTPPYFDKFDTVIDSNGRLATVHNVEPFGEDEIFEAYRVEQRELRRLGIKYSSYARTAKQTFPSGQVVAIGINGTPYLALVDAWSCERVEVSETLPYMRL
jgi:hypothetical protein